MKYFELLLFAFPRAFRERFGEAMRYAFRQELAEARAEGTSALVRLWIGTTMSIVFNGMGERMMGGMEMVTEATRELRHAVRRLVRRPAFTATGLAVLAVGIGGTTAMFSVIEGVVLRPLPYEAGSRLVTLEHQGASGPLGMNDAAYLHYAEQSRTIEELGIWYEVSSPVAGLGEPIEVNSVTVSPNLLSTLGVEPVRGRGFVADDHEPGAARVVLVTHDFWVRRLGGDPEAVGGPMLPGAPEIVVGVLPEGFTFLRPDALVVFGNRFDAPDVVYPMPAIDPTQAGFGNFYLQGVGRLAPGATVDDALQELDALMYGATEAYPGGIPAQRLRDEGYRPVVRPLKKALVGDVERVLWLLLGAVGFVLVIALANVANLFLVRAETRTGELAVRRALGASRASLTLASASEALILSVLGGGAGLLVARAGTDALLRLVPGTVPRLEQVGLTPTVLGFALLVSMATAVALALVQRAHRGADDLRARLGEGGRSAAGSAERSRVRRVLLVSQVAFSLVLLVGSALLASSFRNLGNVDPGFDPQNVLTLRLPLSGSILTAAGISAGPADRRRTDFMLALTQRIEEVPGVEVAALSADLPLDGDAWHDHVATEDAWPTREGDAAQSQRVFVGPGYLSAIGARMVRGRELERQDFIDQPRVAVVNESFARQRWPGQNPIGRRLAQYVSGVDPAGDIFYTVVGVVDDVRETSLMTPAEPTVYYPTVFLPAGGFGMWVSNLVLVVRTAGDPMAVYPSVRDEILAFRPDVPIKDVATLEAVAESSFAEVAFAMMLIGVAAAVSLLLGIVGIYGTVSFVVAQRTREFGLRMALGASRREVSRGVLRRGFEIGVQGLLVGLLAAAVGVRFLDTMLFGVSARSPVIYASTSAALLAVVLIASLVPARRAARIDPMVAMRAE